MTTHLDESLQRDFDRIRDRITKMAEIAVRTLQAGVPALEKRDRQAACVMILRDQLIDALEKQIDQLCLQFIVRHQPAGTYLRFAYASLQTNFQLERVGDYAESIARQILKLIDLNCALPPNIFADISTASTSMLHNAVMAFLRQDAELATATALIEERVDELRNQLNSELMHLVQQGQVPLAALTPLLTIARRFERVSDQAKSMCQETLYFCTGEYAKHAGGVSFRVLFVDAEHGCLSQMAEAIGRSLQRPEFTFASAGLEARPLPPSVVEFLRKKGIGSAPQPSRRLEEVPDLSSFQIVIALTAGVARRLPPPTRKAVYLEWPIADPCQDGQSSERTHVDLETAYAVLRRNLSELLFAIVGDQKNEPVDMHAL